MQTKMMFAAAAVLMLSACATMSSEKGRYSINGITLDPITAVAVSGEVNLRQDAMRICEERQRVAAEKYGVLYDPATCAYSVSGGNAGYGYGGMTTPASYWGRHTEQQLYYPNGFSGQAMPAVYTVQGQPDGGNYATAEDVAKLSRKVDRSVEVTKGLLKKMVQTP